MNKLWNLNYRSRCAWILRTIRTFRAAAGAAIPAAEALGPAAAHEKLDLGVLFTNKLPIRIRDRIPTDGDRALICP
ncbi:MAG: hypothetical protein DMG29_19000 [Acidobacteria bacterium]|nr:MAG: hypothetical protein DMG29_19000 [Acidobacteriota bacterium]